MTIADLHVEIVEGGVRGIFIKPIDPAIVSRTLHAALRVAPQALDRRPYTPKRFKRRAP